MIRKPILESLIKKHIDFENHYVYRLSYAGKYIIVKGKTIHGSLELIEKGYWWFTEKKVAANALYLHLYRHVKRHHPNGRFALKILLKTTDQRQLLQFEQEMLDKCRYDQKCLNNNTEAYIPEWNELTSKYLWLEKTAVMSLKKYLKSQARKELLRQYKTKSVPTPARNALKARTGSSFPASV